MDMETLRMVLDTVQSVARTAGYAGVFWITLHYMAMILVPTVPYIAVIWGLVVVSRHGFAAWRKPQEVVHTHILNDFSFSSDAWKEFKLLVMEMEDNTSYGRRIIYSTQVNRLRRLLAMDNAKAKGE